MAAKDYIAKTKLYIFQYMSNKQKTSSLYFKTSCEKNFKKYAKMTELWDFEN